MSGKKDKVEENQKDDENENIVYEEIIEPRNLSGGRMPPPFNRFAPPPFGGVIIEEEIIEEYEVDDNSDTDTLEEEIPQNSTSTPEKKILVQPSPINKVQPQRHAKPIYQNDSSQAKSEMSQRVPPSASAKHILLIFGVFVLISILIGIYFASRKNIIFQTMSDPNPTAVSGKPINNITLRLPESKASVVIKNFYEKISNNLTIPNLRDIIVTGTIDFLDGEELKSFYAIKRYDSGTFIKVGTDVDEKTYLISAKDNGVYLLEEGRTGGRKILLSPEKSGLLRALTEWDDDIYPAAFAMQMTGKRYNPSFTYIGEKNLAGKAAIEIHAAFEEADDTSYFFDPKSNLIVGISYPAGKSEIKILMGKYTNVDEIYKFPVSRTIYYGDKKIAELNVTFTSVNRGLFFPM